METVFQQNINNKVGEEDSAGESNVNNDCNALSELQNHITVLYLTEPLLYTMSNSSTTAPNYTLLYIIHCTVTSLAPFTDHVYMYMQSTVTHARTHSAMRGVYTGSDSTQALHVNNCSHCSIGL
jgi:hypothetical protein